MPNLLWKNSLGIVLLVLLFGAAPAQAQTVADDPCLRASACQELLAHAQAASLAQQYEEALQTYQKAYSSSQAPWLLVNIGRMQHKLTRYPEAKQSYQDYLATPPKPGDDEQRNTARDFLQQTESQLASQKNTNLIAAPAPQTAPRPIYKKWWFWTIIGGVVAGGVAGTVAGIYARPQLPAVPANAQFRPFE